MKKTVTVTCANPKCRFVFERNPSRGRPQIYCDATCRRQHQYEIDHEPSRDDRVGTDPLTGEIFNKSRTNQIYACTENYHRHRYEMNKQKQVKVKEKTIESVCNYCGTKFMSYRGANMCSNSCRVNFTKQYRFPDYVTKGREIDSDSFIEEDQSGYIYIDCVFDKCDFSHVKFVKARFIRCDFDTCIFDSAVLEGVLFDDCEFFGNNTGHMTRITLTKVPLGLNLTEPVKAKGRSYDHRHRLLNILIEKAELYA